ncbi:MAG TPA: YgcG family protein [Candidatus Binatia bacterium]|nr:YgcG family protein [Candidatus Binatia bacterium]
MTPVTKPHLSRLFASGSVFVLILSLGSLAFALDVPPLRGRINDLASLITADAAKRLEESLGRFEKETGHQIAVLTIPSLEGEDLEGFSIRVAETWKIGQKGVDNGAILLIARDDRKLRIEVGYGLEGVLPDAIASRIIREVIVPHFRSNDYSGGIEAGVDAMMKVTRGEDIAAAQSKKPQQPTFVVAGGALLLAAFLACVIGMTQATLLRGAFGGATAAAIVAALGAFSVGLGLLLITILLGALLGGLSNFYARQSWGRTWNVRGRRYDDYWPRDTFRGGFGGGGFGGGGFGGGGFSGGGGGFGGGGASGSW